MSKKKSASSNGAGRNPLYVKIGKRIRQARLMARESNGRELSARLGWSAGRLHNYETGLSTPGVDETLQLCDALNVDPCWITYGVGAPRPADLHSTRYRNFIDALDQAEKEGYLEVFLDALRLSLERMRKFRRNPYAKIPDVMARRCEKYLGKRRGWIDAGPAGDSAVTDVDAAAQELLSLYARLGPENRKHLIEIGQVLAG